jgi:hypothetical protein
MDIADYRKRVQAEIDDAASASRQNHLAFSDATATGGSVIDLVLDPTADPQQRVTALNDAAIEISKRQALMASVIGLVQDGAPPPRVRRAALAVLRAASFRVASFAPMRPQFLDALRSIVDDPDAELRTQAIEVLAQEKDDDIQGRLMDGLERPEAALVAPELALEFLGYDLHAAHLPIVRRLAQSAANPVVKQQAVRLLSADNASVDLLKDVFEDRSQATPVRTAAAASLQALVPAQFAEIASRVVIDENETSQVRATSVSALDHFHFGAAGSAAASADFVERVRQLQSSTSAEIRDAATRFTLRREK